MLNMLLETPIVGIFVKTPKWLANPHPLLCKIPFPSTKIQSGYYNDFLYKIYKMAGTSLNAKKPGM